MHPCQSNVKFQTTKTVNRQFDKTKLKNMAKTKVKKFTMWDPHNESNSHTYEDGVSFSVSTNTMKYEVVRADSDFPPYKDLKKIEGWACVLTKVNGSQIFGRIQSARNIGSKYKVKIRVVERP